MLDSTERSLEFEQEQHVEVVTSTAESSSAVSSSSSGSTTSSASSVERDIIAKPSAIIPASVHSYQLAVGYDEVDRDFGSRNPSPANCTAPAAAAAPPAPPHKHRIFPVQLTLDDIPADILSEEEVQLLLGAPASSQTAIGEPSNFNTLEVETGQSLFGKAFPDGDDDEEEVKDVIDASSISVPNYNDSSGSYEPPSNNTSNTSISANEDEEIREDETTLTRKTTRSKHTSIVPDTSTANTRASSRLKVAAGSQVGAGKFNEGHTFNSLKEFLEQVSPKLRDNNHHVTIHVQEDFNEDLDLSIMSASMTCANNKTPIGCGCTVVALQKIDEEYHQKMESRKGYRPRFKWQITVCQPAHCLACLISATNLFEEQIDQNHEAWLADKAYYQDGNKVSITSDDELDGEADEQSTRGRASTKRSHRSASEIGRKRVAASARLESSRHPSMSGVPGRNEDGFNDSDMDISPNEEEDRSDAQSDASEEVITVSASFNGPRLSQVKKEGTPYAQLGRSSSSSKSGSRVHRETIPLGPIPGHADRASSSKSKNKTSTRDFYGSASSSKRSKASSSAEKKMLPPACVLRNHAKSGLNKNSKLGSSSTTKARPSSSLGLRKRSRSESETSDTPEVPQEPYGEFPRFSSASRSPPRLPPPHLLQAPWPSARKSASPLKRQKSHRDFPSPKTKFSASTPVSSFQLLPIASEVIADAELHTLGDFMVNGATSRNLLVWFLRYYILMKFGVDGLEDDAIAVNGDGGSEEANKLGQKLKGKETMQLMAASRLLGSALAQLEAEQE